MTLFIIILVIAAVICLMVYKTKREKEILSLAQKPAETSIMSTPAPTPAAPSTPAPAPEPPQPQEPLPPKDNPQSPQGPTW